MRRRRARRFWRLERDHEILQARVAKLRRQCKQLAEEMRLTWLTSLEREWKKIDKAQRRRTAELEAGFARQRDLRAAWLYVDALEYGENAEHVFAKALAPGNNLAADLGDLVAILEGGSAEVSIGRVSRQRTERIDREDAGRRAHEKAIEEARQEFAAQRHREPAGALTRANAATGTRQRSTLVAGLGPPLPVVVNPG